jgi:hypothetical protein
VQDANRGHGADQQQLWSVIHLILFTGVLITEAGLIPLAHLFQLEARSKVLSDLLKLREGVPSLAGC